DDQSVFMPSDGREPVRVSESEIATEGNALSQEELQAVLAQMQNLSRNRLTAAQIASMKSFLESSPGMLIDKSKKIPIASQLTLAQVQPNGAAMIQSINGFVMMDGSGSITSSMSTTAMFGTGGKPMFGVAGGAVAMVAVEGILSLALAVYLLVIGILAL